MYSSGQQYYLGHTQGTQEPEPPPTIFVGIAVTNLAYRLYRPDIKDMFEIKHFVYHYNVNHRN